MKKPIYDKAHSKFRWNKFKSQDPETMFALFTMPQVDADNLIVFEHMKQLSQSNGNEAGIFAQYMKGATFMIQTPKLLDQVVQRIDKIQMDDRDTKGDLYEYLLSKIATACDTTGAGEYAHEHHPEWFHEKKFTKHFNSNMFTGMEFDPTMLRMLKIGGLCAVIIPSGVFKPYAGVSTAILIFTKTNNGGTEFIIVEFTSTNCPYCYN